MTIQWVSGGRVNIETMLATSGESLVNKVLRNMGVVRVLGFAIKVDMTAPYDESPIPEGPQRLCDKYGIDSEAYARRSKVSWSFLYVVLYTICICLTSR
jgi:hypothetical protein